MIIKYIILAAYFAILFGIGIIASRRIKTLQDFYVGGKRLGYWVVAFSARATGESAWLLLGLTGLGAMVGLSAMWVVLGELIGVAVAWFLMAERFKKETDRFRSVTIPDYLVSFFKERGASKRATTVVRIVAATALILFVTIYVSAQIDATGKAFESFLGWPYYYGLFAGFSIVVVYTFAGGFIAVAWSDLFQGLLMLVGLTALPIFAWLNTPSGRVVWDTLGAIDPGLVSIWGTYGLSVAGVLTAISFASVGLGFLGSPQVFVRFMSLGDVEDLKRGRWVALVYTLLTDAGAVLVGMFGRYILAPEFDPVPILGGAAEEVLPLLVTHLFPVTVVGLYIAAVLAAIMSTIDSLLVVASSAATRDLYQQIFNPEKRGDALTNQSRMMTLVLAIVALGIALSVSVISPDRTVYWYVIFGWSGIAATFCPTIMLTLWYPKFNARGAICAMVTGMFAVPLFKFGMPLLAGVGHGFGLLGEMAPSVLLSLVIGIVFSRGTQ